MKKFFLILLLGNESAPRHKPNPFYSRQKQNLKEIWHNKTYNDFGLERIIRIILQLIAFFTPGGLVRHFTGGSNLLFRKIGIEIYGIFKVVFIWLCIHYKLTTNTCLLILVIILSADTLHFLISRILLNDVWRQPISYKRSLIMTFLNYVEVCLCFAFIYSFINYQHYDPNNNPSFLFNGHLQPTNGILDATQIIYFSFVTAATVGYGDISPGNSLAMHVVNTQIIVSLFFVVVFISNLTSKMEDETFYNKKTRKQV